MSGIILPPPRPSENADSRHATEGGKETGIRHLARTALVLLFVSCCVMASAQQVAVTLVAAGTLPNKIGEKQKNEITSLKVSGPINGTDVAYLREMAGKDETNFWTYGELVDLDLTDANIVEGGGLYYRDRELGDLYTETNVLGVYMFFGCQLESIRLPNSVTSIGNAAFYRCDYLTSVTIPNSVKSIGDYAFYSCPLLSISIPNSVTSIGEGAFRYCGDLTSVTIPNSVTNIGEAAFYECSSLTSVNIGNSVKSIGNFAFYLCSSLTSVTIPCSVTSIGYRAFSGCPIDTLILEDGDSVLGVGLDGLPYSIRKLYLGRYFSGKELYYYNLEEVTIGPRITAVKDSLFWFCGGLISVTIPNSVTSIGKCAFYKCSSLTSVNIGSSVKSIGNNAFSDCSSLTSVTIPNSVTNIGEAAFRCCRNLASVTISDYVTDIGYEAFYQCSSLSSVSIPNSVTGIGERAFFECYSLSSVSIGNSVKDIGKSAFSACTGLTSVTIPNSVTNIGECAFSNCYDLTSVNIGNSVTNIGVRAFSNCQDLAELAALCTTPPVCGYWALCDINKNSCTLFVPAGSLPAYKAADQWKDFFLVGEVDPTGVRLPESGAESTVVGRYDASGRLMNGPFRGLNILKMSDGTVKKVMVK